jgi:hypothetical protein
VNQDPFDHLIGDQGGDATACGFYFWQLGHEDTCHK